MTVLNHLREQPFILLFAVVGAGYLVGRVKLKGISLGPTVSTLIIALGVSLFSSAVYSIPLKVPEFASTLFFNLFMFSMGVKVGPLFLSGLKRDARYLIILGLLTPLLAVGLTLLVDRFFHLPPGLSTGVLSGSNTATPGLGAATDALRSGAARLPAGSNVEDVIARLSTTFAFTYCISMLAFVVMMKALPHIFGRDAAREAQRFMKDTAGESKQPLPGTADEFFVRESPADVRTYRLESPQFIRRSVGELRKAHPLVAVERVRRAGEIFESHDDMVLEQGDILALASHTDRLIDVVEKNVGPEISDPELRDVGRESADLVIRNRRFVGMTLGDLAAEHGHGLYLNAVFRSGEPIPYGRKTVLAKGDVLRVTGSKRRISDLSRPFGQVVKSSLSTDIVTLAIGLCVGALIGAITIPIGAVRFSLGSAVGLLLTGIALSILRTKNPAFGGPFPEPARQLLEDLGLNVFVAILGINSGGSVIDTARGELKPILLAVVIVGFVPPLIAWIIGQYRFKMNSAILLGAVAGARCNSAGMRASQEETRSPVPAVSYPVTFALSNIVLTLSCYVLSMLKP
jgi:putative transport protein